MDKSRIIYSLAAEDISTVANEIGEREPTAEEVRYIEENLGEHIQWFAIIESLLRDLKS